jgi:hypothetical protein
MGELESGHEALNDYGISGKNSTGCRQSVIKEEFFFTHCCFNYDQTFVVKATGSNLGTLTLAVPYSRCYVCSNARIQNSL